MTNANSVFEQVKQIVVDRFGVPEEKVTESLTFNDLGADSLDVVELVMEMEDTFNVQFDDSRIEELKNVGEFVAYIESLKA